MGLIKDFIKDCLRNKNNKMKKTLQRKIVKKYVTSMLNETDLSNNFINCINFHHRTIDKKIIKKILLEGYKKGFEDAILEETLIAYNKGYELGEKEGYENGFDEGYETANSFYVETDDECNDLDSLYDYVDYCEEMRRQEEEDFDRGYEDGLNRNYSDNENEAYYQGYECGFQVGKDGAGSSEIYENEKGEIPDYADDEENIY